MIGISRQTTNEVLNGMEAQGILQEQRGGLEIRNLSELKAISH